MVEVKKTIMLCADDYGLNSSVSQGIRELVALNRLSLVSCLVNFENLETEAKALLQIESPVSIGLHFNLTEGYALSHPQKKLYGLNELLVKSHLGLIRCADIEAELHTQLDAFLRAFGRLPDFLDGHQHVHQFPIINKAVLNVYKKRLKGCFVRCTYPTIGLPKYRFKALIMALSGGVMFNRRLKRADIPHNESFSGIYDFSNTVEYAHLFNSWLSLVKSNTLIMCHPGYGKIEDDAIAESRLRELAYFKSDVFVTDCETMSVICMPNISMKKM
jgi:chitin disaccharide deacetylase